MKAVISNKIFMEVDFFLKEEIDKELSFVIPPSSKFGQPIYIKHMSRVNDKIIAIPGGRLDLVPKDYEIVDKRVLVPVTLPKFPYKLRPSQQEIYDQIDEHAIINAPVAWGKTFLALAIAKKLGQKTLVVVHNKTLRGMWVKEIKNCFNFTPGIIGSGLFETDTPIVVGNSQTLYKHLDKISSMFGTIILDEMHHSPASTFEKIITSSLARYRIGLSGTVKRKDGKHILFPSYFGHVIFTPKAENYMVPEVNIIKTDIYFPEGGKVPWAIMNNELAADPNFQILISMLAETYAKKGHKVLVVSNRTRLLRTCGDMVGDKSIVVTGETDEVIRDNLFEIMKEKDILFGTMQIFSEGVSINNLSALIIASPVNNEPLLTQLIGRVVRQLEGKKSPVIVDLWLKGNIVTSQSNKRLNYYMGKGYKITFY